MLFKLLLFLNCKFLVYLILFSGYVLKLKGFVLLVIFFIIVIFEVLFLLVYDKLNWLVLFLLINRLLVLIVGVLKKLCDGKVVVFVI